MWRPWLGVLPVVMLFACANETPMDEEPTRTDEEASTALAPYIERADQAMVALQSRLLEALTNELDRSGPVGAIQVCRDAAQDITAETSTTVGVQVGRTSHRLRNPTNAPPDWARDIVESAAGTAADAASQHVLDLGDRVCVLRPIGTLGMCTACHGDESNMEPELKELIADAYPDDKATGFEVGDLRGWMWAEVPRDE